MSSTASSQSKYTTADEALFWIAVKSNKSKSSALFSAYGHWATSKAENRDEIYAEQLDNIEKAVLDPPVLTARLDYANRGWWTFPAPLDGSKKSLKWACKESNDVNWGATLDAEVIRAEFDGKTFHGKDVSKQNVGIATGAQSGIFVIETDTAEHSGVDGEAALTAWQVEHDCVLPETLKARTPSGSIHRYLNHPGQGVKVKSFNAIFGDGSGVDCKGDGGMVIGVPSTRPARPGKAGGTYEWINAGHPIADAPQALLDVVIEKQPTDEELSISQRAQAFVNAAQSKRRNGSISSYAQKALDDECGILGGTLPGNRNHQLNKSAFNLGQLVGGGELSESEVFDALIAAATANGMYCNDGYQKACEATLYSGLESGKKHPRSAPRSINTPPVEEEQVAQSKSQGNGKDETAEAAAIKAATTKPESARKKKPKEPALTDFHSNMQTHTYIYVPTRELWPAISVNARILPILLLDENDKPVLNDEDEEIFIKPNTWLDQNRPVEQLTWCPGLPTTIANRLVSEGGWFDHDGVTIFNLYRPPTIKLGDSNKAQPWIDLVQQVYPEDAEEIFNFFAHRQQHPDVKINHGLVLGGDPGIGKDTLVEGLVQAVGAWNCKEVSPQDMMGTFNDYMQSVVLRISEARDLGEINRYSFYDHMKTVTATPPDVVRVNAKYTPQHYVFNVCGVIITTNYKTNGIYLPADDRRTYVAWSDLKSSDFPANFWIDFWNWYTKKSGFEHVAAFLEERDLSEFDPKAPPEKTPAFWAIVDANAAPEEGELADVLDKMIAARNSRPLNATTLLHVTGYAEGYFQEWLMDRKNRRAIPHRFETCGFVPVRNTATKDALWVIGGKRQVIYARAKLSLKDQIKAAQRLSKGVF
jgi:Bifunctional DNA primase/polymerase, N-terminal/Family of unknown function (DUF5906)